MRSFCGGKAVISFASCFAFLVCTVVSTCGPGQSGEATREFRLIVPDSMASWKTRTLRSMERWGEGLPFRFSESAAHVVTVNDSATYSNSRFRLLERQWFLGSDSMNAESASLLHYSNGNIRFVSARSGPRSLMGALHTLFTEYRSFDEVLLVFQYGQPIYAAGDSVGRWVVRVNVFEERAEFRKNPKQNTFTFYGNPIPFSQARVQHLLSQVDSRIVRDASPRIFVYPNFETKARVSANLMEYSIDVERREIHLVDDAHVRTRFEEILSIYFTALQYGQKYPWLTDGLAFVRAGTYYGKPPDWWKTKYPLLSLVKKGDLLTAPQTNQNPFLMHLLAMEFWREQADPSAVWKSPETFVEDFDAPVLDQGPVRRATEIPFFKGFCFAHSNGVQTGYTSQESARSLQRLEENGANAVSLTPFGYSADARSPDIHFVLRNIWDETLGGLVKAARDAHERGMDVMMKPHLWLGNGQWCGEVDVAEGPDRDRWENQYSQFIVYHALIAELCGMESLSVGVELPHMTADTQMWKRIIRHVRVAYSGAITFGGNWFGEYDRIQFWDDLDFIGVQHYFPLMSSAEDGDSRKVLRGIKDTMRAVSVRWNRPVVLTEVGFPSIEGALMSPHDEDFSQSVSDERQAQGYRMLIEELSDEPWCKGFFWWKWESADRDPRAQDKSFQIRGKLAEKVVREFYRSSTRRL